MPEVGGVVHTHSTYATAWAARGESIPCVLTMMADEFGGEIPVGPFALIGDDSIGQGIVETLRDHRSPAVLMQNHGPFTIGPTAKAAVKAAVMCEEVARTVHIARQLGRATDHRRSPTSTRFTPDIRTSTARRPIDRLRKRVIMTANPTCWFLTGSQGLYGPETLAQVEQQSRAIGRSAQRRRHVCRCRCEWKPVLTESSAIHQIILAANADPDCVGLIAWMHTFSPAKMWITGLNALQTPFLHLHTQANVSLPWAEIDMDFMNLNQAAHGDREFGYIQTRLGVPRTTVAGHVVEPGCPGPDRRLAAGRGGRRRRPQAASWPGSATTCATSRSPRGTRSRPSCVSGSRSTPTASTTWSSAVDAVADAEVDDLVEQYGDSYDIVPELRPGGDRHDSLRYGARIEAGLRVLPDRRRFRGVHHQLPRPRGAAPAARVWPCSG